MSTKQMNSFIDSFPQTRLLCVGDMMMDVFVYGKSSRLSPEAPVPVMVQERETRMLGGAGNVVTNLCKLGCRTLFAGAVGDDADGRLLAEYMQEMGADASLLHFVPGYSTAVKTRFCSGAHHLLRVDREAKLCLPEELVQQILEQVEQRLPSTDLVLLSDYGKGLFDERLTPALISLCNKYGVRVIVDPKRSDYTIYGGATLIKPNLKEFSEATGKQYDPAKPEFFGEAVSAGRNLCQSFGISNLLVTLSEHGMIFIPAEEKEIPFIIPTEALEVFDVSGAGDTSLAALGAALAVGARMDQAIRIANKASGIVVGKFGTASVTPDELKAELPGASSSRVLAPKQAQKLVRSLREQGKCIGFTNGCFDLLHPGHLQSFALARQACDVLIVGLNSDASVRRLKGPSRPINNEQSRAALLCGLKHVDYVVIFDDDTALPLIDLLRPDVIAKEGYPLDRWPEGQAVIAYGGRALELPRLEGFSSTNIISKLS